MTGLFDATLHDETGMWVSTTIRYGWRVAGLYLIHRGAMHLAELRIFPDESFTGYGWMQTVDALDSTPAPQAIHARLIRLVPLEEMQRYAELAALIRPEFAKALRESRASTETWEQVSEVPAEMTRAKLDYLEAAVRFVEAARSFREPRTRLANALGISPQQLSDRLKWARKHGYLTSPGQGRAGGELTEVGVRLAVKYIRKS
jgi:hypothetical protein